LAVTTRPPSSSICCRPWSNGASGPTGASMRRTPGALCRCTSGIHLVGLRRSLVSSV
jgi:hypothetical protein